MTDQFLSILMISMMIFLRNCAQANGYNYNKDKLIFIVKLYHIDLLLLLKKKSTKLIKIKMFLF